MLEPLLHVGEGGGGAAAVEGQQHRADAVEQVQGADGQASGQAVVAHPAAAIGDREEGLFHQLIRLLAAPGALGGRPRGEDIVAPVFLVIGAAEPLAARLRLPYSVILAVLGVLIAAVAWIWQGNAWLGLVVGAALSINTLVAVSIGGTVPVLLKAAKIDPAVASGPILTTITDMCGFFLVLSLASMAMPYLV